MSLHHTQMPGLRLSTLVDKGNDTYKPIYREDGRGRDLFISRNNGGFNPSYHTPAKANHGGDAMYLGTN